MSTAPTVATKDMTEALKLFMQAKIGCANTIHDLDTLDGITDDWPSDKPTLAGFALEIHLSCEAGIKEDHAMVDILDHFMEQISKDGTSSVFEFVELVGSSAETYLPIQHADPVNRIADRSLRFTRSARSRRMYAWWRLLRMRRRILR